MKDLLHMKSKKCITRSWLLGTPREILVPRKLLRKDDLNIGLDRLERERRLYFYRSPTIHDRIYDSETKEILCPFLDLPTNHDVDRELVQRSRLIAHEEYDYDDDYVTELLQ